MRDLQIVAAEILKVGLWAGTAIAVAAGALHLAGAERMADLTGVVGIGVIVATPFVTLVALAVRARCSVVGCYAAVTLVFALLGVMLAR
jgi:hypothetical protein